MSVRTESQRTTRVAPGHHLSRLTLSHLPAAAAGGGRVTALQLCHPLPLPSPRLPARNPPPPLRVGHPSPPESFVEVKKQQPRETPGVRPGPQGDRSSFSVPSPPRRSLNPSTQIVWVSITAGRYPQCLPNKGLGGGELGSGGSCEETLGRGKGGAQDTEALRAQWCLFCLWKAKETALVIIGGPGHPNYRVSPWTDGGICRPFLALSLPPLSEPRFLSLVK